tara:strand:- start:2483 stop:3547 length:1065 start_codon:yes stop_codon:yes gene_type:complete
MYMYTLTNANTEFGEIKALRSKIEGDFTMIHTKLKALRKIYSEVVIKHRKIECTLGVDALFFQSELIEKEYNNLQQMFNFINNRIYCEYYKLYYYIKDYIVSSIDPDVVEELKMEADFPAYKSIDTSIVYDFGNVLKMQSEIVDILSRLDKYFKDNVSTNNKEKNLLNMGLHIDTVIHTQDYMNSVMEVKIKMFYHYLKTFNTHHKKHLNRLYTKTEMVVNIISDDMPLNAEEPSQKPSSPQEEKEEPSQNPSTPQEEKEEPSQKPSSYQEEKEEPSQKPSSYQEEEEPSQKPSTPQEEEPSQSIPTSSNISNIISPVIKYTDLSKNTLDTSGDVQKFAKSVVSSENINFKIHK